LLANSGDVFHGCEVYAEERFAAALVCLDTLNSMTNIRILIASNNAHKLQEFGEITQLYAPAGLRVELVTPEQLGLSLDPDETASTYMGNAQIKARAFHNAISQKDNLIVLADDSGLEVDALDGRPGVLSARYHKSAPHGDGCAALIRELAEMPTASRAARFHAVIVLIYPDGREFALNGVCEGRIAHEKRGAGGFGFDPVFFVEDDRFDGTRTMSELTSIEKHSVSHRGRAMQKVLQEIATHRA